MNSTTPYIMTNSPTVLLTGASSGIGLELARKLWKLDYNVVITARKESLSKFAAEKFSENERFLIRPLDVTKSTQRESVVSEINQLWGGVDILINNAGISYRSVIEHMGNQDEELQMATNYFGPIALIKLVVPKMRQKRQGRIINVSSVGGMMAMPTMGSYSASKFALEGASEALWYELKPWNIHVSLVEPGFIRSNSFKNVYLSEKAKKSIENKDEYNIYYQSMCQFIENLMSKAFSTSDDIADKIIDLMEDKKPCLRTYATLDAYFFTHLRRVLPRKLYHAILYRNLPNIKKWGNETNY